MPLSAFYKNYLNKIINQFLNPFFLVVMNTKNKIHLQININKF
jgi:hypothetical protein